MTDMERELERVAALVAEHAPAHGREIMLAVGDLVRAVARDTGEQLRAAVAESLKRTA